MVSRRVPGRRRACSARAVLRFAPTKRPRPTRARRRAAASRFVFACFPAHGATRRAPSIPRQRHSRKTSRRRREAGVGSSDLTDAPRGSAMISTRREFVRGITLSAATLSAPGAFAQAIATAVTGDGPFYPDRLPLDTDNDLL